METIGIVGWQATKDSNKIVIQRAYAGTTEQIATSDWNEAVEFLTSDFGKALCVVWDLDDFVDAVLSLIPKEVVEELETKNRVVFDNVKVFHVDRWFGLTYTKLLRGNIYDKFENNFFGIQAWMPNQAITPDNACLVEAYGIQIVEALAIMGIVPDRLTSPVGSWANTIKDSKLPTIYSNKEIVGASQYCEYMMGREWRSAYQVGYFQDTWDWDMVGAYPYQMANLPNTDKCKVVYSDVWLKANWSICKAEVDITADKTPIVYDTEEGDHLLTVGKRIDIFTIEELMWLHQHKAATIKFIDGYFFKWLTNNKPYYPVMAKLYNTRGHNNELVAHLARRISQGMSGKLDQTNKDGSYGEFYNPIYASMTRSRCRISVADFIWNNNLQDDLIAVQVDGVLTSREVELKQSHNGMGSWRLDTKAPALVLGKGEIWLPNKKPLNLTMQEVVDAMVAHPKQTCYTFNDGSFIDLAVMAGDNDRIYSNFPRNGDEALSKITQSRPMTMEEAPQISKQEADNARA